MPTDGCHAFGDGSAGAAARHRTGQVSKAVRIGRTVVVGSLEALVSTPTFVPLDTSSRTTRCCCRCPTRRPRRAPCGCSYDALSDRRRPPAVPAAFCGVGGVARRAAGLFVAPGDSQHWRSARFVRWTFLATGLAGSMGYWVAIIGHYKLLVVKRARKKLRPATLPRWTRVRFGGWSLLTLCWRTVVA